MYPSEVMVHLMPPHVTAHHSQFFTRAHNPTVHQPQHFHRLFGCQRNLRHRLHVTQIENMFELSVADRCSPWGDRGLRTRSREASFSDGSLGSLGPSLNIPLPDTVSLMSSSCSRLSRISGTYTDPAWHSAPHTSRYLSLLASTMWCASTKARTISRGFTANQLDAKAFTFIAYPPLSWRLVR